MCLGSASFDNHSLLLIHNHIYNNLSSNNVSHSAVAESFPKELDNLENLISRTFSHGESNSAFLIAPRGGGKSALLESILHKLEEKKLSDVGLIVRLNGLLQTDDRLALMEITRQFQLEAETSTKFGSFAENLAHILQTLKSGSKEESRPVLFILDEFDLFCHHHNQTLLYNLFDVAQSAQSPICVIGLSARLDVIELLEKRVKSRFSHRQIFLLPNRTFEEYKKIAKGLLTVHSHHHTDIKKETLKKWNKHVVSLIDKCEHLLKRRYQMTTDFRSLKQFLTMVCTHLNGTDLWLTQEMFNQNAAIISQDAKFNVLKDLSILQLCLIVAMKHILKVYDGEPFNFEMVHHEYAKFCRKHSQMTSFERPVVFKAFDQLECVEIIRPVDGVRSTVQRDYRLMQLMMLPAQVEEAITNIPNVPTFLAHWSNNSLI